MVCHLYRIQFFTMVAYFTNAHSMQFFEGFPKLNVYIYQIQFIFKSISVKVCANHLADMQMCLIKHPTIVFSKKYHKSVLAPVVSFTSACLPWVGAKMGPDPLGDGGSLTMPWRVCFFVLVPTDTMK